MIINCSLTELAHYVTDSIVLFSTSLDIKCGFRNVCLLDTEREIARLVTDAVWNISRNLRDCVTIGKLARFCRGRQFYCGYVPKVGRLTNAMYSFSVLRLLVALRF